MEHIIIHQGNRLEDLALHLGELMQEKRRQKFSLKPDLVLVNNYEMSQWLSIQVAENQGICANVLFRLFGSFAWDLAGGLLSEAGDTTPMTGDCLRWTVFRCLREIAEGHYRGTFSELESYIARQGSGGIYHLSIQLADLFDRYLNYRFDMLYAWEQGRKEQEHGWQPDFWKILSHRTTDRLRVTRLRQLINRLKSDHSDMDLPRCIYLFGVSYLPPLHLDILSALSGITETHMFVLSPCGSYWMDTVSEKKRAALKKNLDAAMVDELFPAGNRLLASMGYAGRSFLARLYGYPLVEGRDFFRKNMERGRGSLLAMIQDDILELRQDGDSDKGVRTVSANDASIQIHSCHSRLREVEVVHDQLVHLLETDDTLYPRDILVMAPCMEEYARLVDAVFGAAPAERRVPYSMADLGLRETDPASRTFLSVFTISMEGFTAPGVMDILAQPRVMERFGLDHEGLCILRDWVRKSGIRRGVSTISDSTDIRQNSWIFGIDRLFVSSCMDHRGFLEDTGIMPMDFPVEGGNATLLATLSAFFFTLVEFSDHVSAGRGFSPDEWLTIFTQLVEDFISEEPDHDAAAPLMDRLTGLVEAMRYAGIEDIDFETMCMVLQDELDSPSPPRSFISGNVLFSSLVPMRSIPFRVICLLGMNDADFPRRPGALAFDLMAEKWRPGDRIPREEDRYLFLETLISARERLLISYVGRREQDDAVQNPAVVLDELVDYMKDKFVLKDKSPVCRSLCVQHPLQPFSLRYLEDTGIDSNRGLITYAREWMPIDDNGAPLAREKPEEFCPGPIPLSEEEQEDLNALPPWRIASFFSNPARFFLKNRLHIDVYTGEDALEEEEPFSLSKDMDNLFLNTLLSLEPARVSDLAGCSDRLLNDIFVQAKARGFMPVEPMGAILWEKKVNSQLIPFIEKKFVHAGVPVETACIDRIFSMPGGHAVRIMGNIGGLGQEGGLLDYCFNVYPGHKISMWIKHLLLMLNGVEKMERCSSVIVNMKTDVVLNKVPEDEACDLLNALLHIHAQGLSMPLRFFPAASYEFVKAVRPARGAPASEEKARDKALAQLFLWNNPGRIKDLWVNYLFRGQPALLKEAVETESFAETGMAIFGPLLDYLAKGR